jgi:hypothetical protein
MTVVLPGAALLYLVRMPGTVTSEGALMRFSTLILTLLIIALPSVSLYLALGFPVAFLIVEVFETRVPVSIRDAIKRRMIL